MAQTVDFYTQALARRTAIMQAIAPDIDVSPGSDVGDELIADAGGSLMVLYALQAAQQQSYSGTATGSNLDNLAADAGLARSAPTFASITVTVSGASGAPSGGWIVPALTNFSTTADANGTSVFFQNLSQATVPASGTAVVAAVAKAAGTTGNIQANGITGMDSTPGVTLVSSTAPAVLAIDQETDTALEARVRQSRAVLGSDAAIAAAALAVAGCAYAYVSDPRDASGHVTVYAAQTDGTLPSALQTSVQVAVNLALVATTTATISAASVVYAVVALSIDPASGYDGATVGAAVVNAAIAFADTLGFGATLQPGPMWAYILSSTGGNVAGLNPGGDWFTTSTTPTVSATQLFRFLAAPPQPVNGAATASQMGYAITSGTGTLAAGAYYVQTAWTDGTHDSLPSTEYALVTTATGEVTFTAPSAFPSNITGLKLFISAANTPGAEKLQTTLASTGATFTLSAAPTTGGAAPATTSTYSAPTVTVVSV